MKKMEMIVGVFLCLSFAALAAEEINSGEIQQKDGIFVTKEGKALDGEYKLRNRNSKSSFVFQRGKMQEFSFDSREEDDFEIDGRFMDNQTYFKGEVSIQKISNNDPVQKVKEELTLDGSMEAKEITQFANEVLTKKEADVQTPSFTAVSAWKMQDGERELEKEFVKKVNKEEKSKKFVMLEVEKKGEKQIYSAGKLVHTAQSSAVDVEKEIKTQ